MEASVHARLLAIAAIAGCSGSDETAPCADGFVRGAGDNCYEVRAAPTTETQPPDDTGGGAPDEGDLLDQLFAGLPECQLEESPDGQLDLEGGCGGPGCVSMTLEELQAAYADDGGCQADGYGYIRCYWQAWDALVYFYDDDGDDLARPDQLPTGLYLGVAFPGSTSDGLAPGQSVACFLDSYPVPSTMEPYEYSGETWIYWWGFANDSWWLLDDQARSGGYVGDGYVDYVWLAGPG